MSLQPSPYHLTINHAREAKRAVLDNKALKGYARGVGIAKDQGSYCIMVNLDKFPPGYIYETFPAVITTSGGDVRVLYKATGKITTVSCIG
jgi:hypothetical protein